MSSPCTRPLSVLLILSALMCLPAVAAGGGDTGRTLSGHVFIPSDVLTSPFITTHVGSSTGIGIASLNVAGENYNLATLGQWLDLQLGLGNWVALRGSITGTVLSGTSTDAALNFGANASYNADAGASVKVFGTNWGILSASFDYGFSNGMQISPLTPIMNTLNSGQLTDEGLFTETTEHQVKGGLQFAVGAHEFFGFWIDGGFAYGWADTAGETSSDGAVNAGGAVSLDFGGITPVALGILAYYNLTYSLAEGANPIHNIGGGVFYTGRPNLVLGLEAAAMMQKVGSDEASADVSAVMAAFRLRYYW